MGVGGMSNWVRREDGDRQRDHVRGNKRAKKPKAMEVTILKLYLIFAVGLASCTEVATTEKHLNRDVCEKTGKVLSDQELIDLAAAYAMNRYKRNVERPDGCREYTSLEEFYSVNPNCCVVDRAKSVIPGPLIFDNSDYSFAGQVRMKYRCEGAGADYGEFASEDRDVSVCGVLLEGFGRSDLDEQSQPLTR